MNEWKEAAFKAVFPKGAVRVVEGNGYAPYEGWGTGIAYDPATQEYLVAEYSHCSCHGADESMGGCSRYDSLIDALRGSTYKTEIWADLKQEVEQG